MAPKLVSVSPTRSKRVRESSSVSDDEVLAKRLRKKSPVVENKVQTRQNSKNVTKEKKGGRKDVVKKKRESGRVIEKETKKVGGKAVDKKKEKKEVILPTVKKRESSRVIKKESKKVGGKDVDKKKEKKEVVLPTVKEWELYIPVENHYPTRIGYDGFSGEKVLENIKNVLTPTQLEMFSKTCFGHFLKLQCLRLQLNLLHSLLLREVKQPNESELWIDVSGRLLRFGLGEFALVTGLNISSSGSKASFKVKNPTLKSKFFGSTIKVTKGMLEDVFVAGAGNFSSDEDALMLAVLYFVECYLSSGGIGRQVSDDNFDVVESGGYQNYCWGREIFFDTVRELRGRLKSWKEDINARKKWRYYCVRYFVLSFQVWFYECCPFVNGQIAMKSSDSFPRMLRWSCLETRSFDDLRIELFSNNAETLGLINIVPSKSELESVVLASYFEESIGDDFVVSIRTPKASASCSIANKDKAVNDGTTMELLLQNQRKMFKKFRTLECKMDSLSEDMKVVMDHMSSMLKLQRDDVDSKKFEGADNVDGDDSKTVSGSDNVGDDSNVVRDVSEQVIDGVGVETGKNFDGATNEGREGHIDVLEKGVSMNVSSDVQIDDADQGDKPSQVEDIVDVDATIGSVIKDLNKNDEDQNLSLKNQVAVNSFKSDDIDSAFIEEIDKVEEQAIISAAKQSKIDTEIEQEQSEDIELQDVNEDVIEGFKTPTQKTDKRTRKLGLFFKSPYDVPWESSSKEDKGSKEEILCPFDDEVGQSSSEYTSDNGFIDWFYKGYVKGKRGSKNRIYTEEADVIDPPLNFNVFSVTSKTWFYRLVTLGQLIESSHLDVIFYYLRKKCSKKLGGLRATTTDNYFDQRMQSLYRTFLESGKNMDLIQFTDNIVGYMTGHMIRGGVEWCAVDHVLFPIHVSSNALGGKLDHWVLGIFSLKERCIHVYDSLKSKRTESGIRSVVEAYSVLLPYFLLEVNFFDGRRDLLSSDAYQNIGSTDPIDVKFELALPTQDNNDCGVFVASFAEYFILGKKIPVKKFNVKSHRLRLAASLWVYGMKKQNEGYCSDQLSPERWLD